MRTDQYLFDKNKGKSKKKKKRERERDERNEFREKT